MTGNLFHDAEPPATGERFDVLARRGDVVIERIVSSATPDATPYVQPHDEWVVVLRGGATLEVDGVPRELRPGDHVLLPAGTPHVVRRTDVGTVWLAVHVHPHVVAGAPAGAP